MKSYETALPEELNKDTLIEDEDFIVDASDYVFKRTGQDLENPEEVYDAFMQQMRYHEVNELDTISDLMYAQEAEGEEREQMARLFDTYDRMEIDFTGDLVNKVKDYGWGIATAPSTVLGFLSGGSAKVATVAGQKASQAALRRVLLGGAVGGAVEGAIGAGQNVAQQSTRMELDPEREFSGTELALTTALSAVPGAATGALGQVRRNGLARKAEKLEAEANSVKETAENIAKENVKKAVDKDSAGVDAVEKELADAGFEEGALVEPGKLNPIDPEIVEEGQSILSQKGKLVEEGYAVVLDKDTVRKVAVVAKEIAERGGVKREKGQRITEAVAKAIANKEVSSEILTDIMDRYNISHRELGPIFASTASDAGRTLQAVGQISKSWDEYINTLKAQKADTPGLQAADGDSVIEKVIKSPIRVANKIERIRRSILTSQPVTTIRNFFGGGARVTLDMFEQFWMSGTRKASNTARTLLGAEPIEDISTIGAGDIARYVWNGEEAKLVADMYMRLDKKGYDRMFSNFIDAAEASNNSATGDGFDRIGSFFNVFNRMSDNFWKKATFAGELSRQTRARYGKSLTQMISDGEFNKIDSDLFENAVDKSFELVYQQTPKGKGLFSKAARGYLEADKRAGFIMGALIPFPRFVINQIKFMYEHAPVLGMLPIDSLTHKGGLKQINWDKKFAQQVNGLGLLGMAYALRSEMGPETEWYNYTKEDGTKLDLRPFLGPLNMQLYIADAIYRSGMLDGERKPIKAAGGMTGEIIQTAIGSSFRAGTGLFVIDRALPELLGSLDGNETTIKTDQVIGQILGDYANTYTYQWPIAVARDLYSLTDEQLRLVPENKIGLDYLEITALRARRSLGPLADWLPRVSEEFMEKDIPYIPDKTIKHMVPFYNVDRPQERFDIFSTEPLRKIDPIRTAVSGLNIRPPANAFTKERIRLQLEPYEIYRNHPFAPADRYIRQELSQKLPIQMEKVINSEEYQNMTDEEKRFAFVREAKYLMNEYRNKSRIDEAIATQIQAGNIPDATLRDHLKWRYESLPSNARKAIESRLGKPDQDSDYTDYIKEYDVIKDSLFAKKTLNFAEGGLVDDPLMLSETVEEEDVATREQEGEDYVKQMIDLGLDLAPVTGEIRSAQQAVKDFEEGNPLMGTLGVIGALPIIGIPGRVAKKAVKMAVNVKKDKKADIDYAELLLSGDKKFETRNSPSLNPYIGQRVGIAKTGDGEAKAIGSVEIGEPIEVDEKTFRQLQDQHLVPEGSEFDIAPGGKKYLYPVSNPERFDAPKSVGRGIVSRKILDDLDYGDQPDLIAPDAEDAMGFLGITKESKDAWRKSREGGKRTGIDEEVSNAAQKLKDKEISNKEFMDIVQNRIDEGFIPQLSRMSGVPDMPTLDEIALALTDAQVKKGIIGLNKSIAKDPTTTTGYERIASRLDIPAYNNYDTWVVAIHEVNPGATGKAAVKGAPKAYAQTSVLKNVEFATDPSDALDIARRKPIKTDPETGEVTKRMGKATIARIVGDYVPHDPQKAKQVADQVFNDPEWTEVGMNPYRASYFYDKVTGEPVIGADEVIQIGPLVMAKGVKKTTPDNPMFKVDPDDADSITFNKGGLMSRK